MRAISAAMTLLLSSGGAVFASDLPIRSHPPTLPQAVAPLPARGIWGSIAYSPGTGANGIDWGSADREEAETIARRHCEGEERSPAPSSCRVAISFYNGWVSSTPAEPWPHCGALAVGSDRWSGAWGLNQEGADDNAMRSCGSATCKIVREVCT